MTLGSKDNDTWAVAPGRGYCAGLDLKDDGMPPDCDGLTMSRIAIRAMEFMSNIVPAMRKIPSRSSPPSTARKVLWSNLEVGSLEAAMDLENRNQLLVRLTTQNLQEAITARKQKRQPKFED